MKNQCILTFIDKNWKKGTTTAHKPHLFFADELIRILPSWVSHLLIQSIAATFGGFTTTIITNPLDVVRARLQVQRLDSMCNAFRVLWLEEGMRMFTKGLSARLVQSACFSFSIILGYETIKRVSIHEEYKSYVRWWIVLWFCRIRMIRKFSRTCIETMQWEGKYVARVSFQFRLIIDSHETEVYGWGDFLSLGVVQNLRVLYEKILTRIAMNPFIWYKCTFSV